MDEVGPGEHARPDVGGGVRAHVRDDRQAVPVRAVHVGPGRGLLRRVHAVREPVPSGKEEEGMAMKPSKCPFCGRAPEVRKAPCDGRHAVICRWCATHGMMVQTKWTNTEKEAVERWNARKS